LLGEPACHHSQALAAEALICDLLPLLGALLHLL